ncbi:MAG TPA: UDP-N-acetylmuramate dehydrogenase [Terriglobia bacterium]|nr:UDP-N-acetylmuramate dehydrogenase [Terriglobia bacterium]
MPTTHVLEIRENVPLKPFTTFKVGGPARYFAQITQADQIQPAIAFAASRQLQIFVLGGGSNLVVSDEGINAFVLHPVGKGAAVCGEGNGGVSIRVEAGEPWDSVVARAGERNWWGIENLSHIPGQAGAAVVQNIGAYGQQLSDVLERAEIAELSSGNVRMLSASECGLGYRRSIFNSTHKSQFLVLNLTLRLSLAAQPRLNYPDVRAWFDERNVDAPTLAEIRAAIIAIRDRKFPFPRAEKDGNAGSFFKNLTLRENEYEALRRRVHDQFGEVASDRLRELRNRFPGTPRVPTAFLIEICGLKGFRMGGAKVSETQPLVLLNQGGATAHDVLMLARHIRQTLYRRIGVKVEIEPELAGFSPKELAEHLAFEGGTD